MPFCPASCSDIALLANPQSTCESQQRYRILSRVAFYPCSVTLPDPMTDMAIKALFDDGTIVATSALANVTFADPTSEDVAIDDCSPAMSVITGRELTAEDRYAVSNTSGSPATTDEYFDYDVLDDKVINQHAMNYMLIFCDGDVVVPLDRAGNPLTATMQVFISYQKPSTQGGRWIEYKKITIRFQNDPLALYTAKPAFNYIDAGITL